MSDAFGGFKRGTKERPLRWPYKTFMGDVGRSMVDTHGIHIEGLGDETDWEKQGFLWDTPLILMLISYADTYHPDQTNDHNLQLKPAILRPEQEARQEESSRNQAHPQLQQRW